MDSSKPRDTVLGQSPKSYEEVPTDTVVVLQVSNGPQEPTEPSQPAEPETVTKQVSLDVSKYTAERDCEIRVFRDEKQIDSQVVPKGQTTMIIASQTGSGTVEYCLVVGDVKDYRQVVFSGNE